MVPPATASVSPPRSARGNRERYSLYGAIRVKRARNSGAGDALVVRVFVDGGIGYRMGIAELVAWIPSMLPRTGRNNISFYKIDPAR